MAVLTILEPSREARVPPGPRGHESSATSREMTLTHSPRVDARGRVDVRVSLAWSVSCMDNESPGFVLVERPTRGSTWGLAMCRRS
jgi:hypothetical protein